MFCIFQICISPLLVFSLETSTDMCKCRQHHEPKRKNVERLTSLLQISKDVLIMMMMMKRMMKMMMMLIMMMIIMIDDDDND